LDGEPPVETAPLPPACAVLPACAWAPACALSAPALPLDFPALDTAPPLVGLPETPAPPTEVDEPLVPAEGASSFELQLAPTSTSNRHATLTLEPEDSQAMVHR